LPGIIFQLSDIVKGVQESYMLGGECVIHGGG